jgi:hypothetical protein
MFRPARAVGAVTDTAREHIRLSATCDDVRHRRMIARMPVGCEEQIPHLRERERRVAIRYSPQLPSSGGDHGAAGQREEPTLTKKNGEGQAAAVCRDDDAARAVRSSTDHRGRALRPCRRPLAHGWDAPICESTTPAPDSPYRPISS